MIQLSVLGSTELRGDDGRALLSVLAQPKRLTLLTYLALTARHGLTRRTKLLELFWHGSDAEKARASLRSSLSYLRKSLGEGVLVTRGDEEVGIAEGVLECDAVHFEAALDDGRPRSAWDFYGGALLDGLHLTEPALERWLEDERSRLERRAVEAARLVADEAEGQGDMAEAAAWARKALALEPLSEVCVAQLIRPLARAGDRDEAIRTYDRFADRLSTELGLEPAAETRALIDAVRVGSPALAPPAEMPVPLRLPAAVAEPRAAPAVTPLAWLLRPLAVSTLALAAVTLVAVFWGARRPPSPEPVVRNIVVMPEGEEMRDEAGRRFALSPDGSRFVYVGGPEGRLWVRLRNQLHARALPGAERAISPFFSPEGDRVGFFTNGELQVLSLEGGPVLAVTDEADMWGGVTWGPDGMLYAATPGFGGLVRLPAEPGAVPQRFTTLDAEQGETNHQWPDARPGGRSVVFSVTRARAGALGSEYSIAVADTESGHHKVLFDGIFARHAGPDHLIYVTADSTLMVVGFESETLEVTGPPSVVARDQRVGFRRSVDVSVSADGTLMYATGPLARSRELVWVTRDGRAEPLDPPWRGDLLFPTISPDGSRVALVERGAETSDVWVGNLETGGRHLLTTEGGVNGYPAWTPDGLSVTYFARTSGAAELWTKSADGNGRAVLQLQRPRDLAESVWSADGRWLVYRTSNIPAPSLTRRGEPVRGAGDILATRPGVAEAPIPLAVTDFAELAPALSPDGRWLAYTSEETGRPEVFVVPFPNPDGTRWAVSTDGGIAPTWSRGTRELFYRGADNAMVALQVDTGPTFSLGRSTALFDTSGYLADGLHPMYAVAPGGDRFLMIRAEPRSPGQLIVVENWFQELAAEGVG